MFFNVADISTATDELTKGEEWTHFFYVVTMALALLGDVLIPILFFRFERTERSRKEMHEDNRTAARELQKRIDHLDECIDEAKEKFVIASATKADLAMLKEDIENMLLSARNVTAGEIAELSKRVYRLEDRGFKRGWL